MENTLILDSISFDDLDFDLESSETPIIISSISAPQLLDSYLITDSGEKRLYKPAPNSILLTYSISLLLDNPKIMQIHSLIKKQIDYVKEFRRGSRDPKYYSGFLFQYSDYNGENINSKVWLTSFTKSGTYYDISTNIKKTRCKLEVQETEEKD